MEWIKVTDKYPEEDVLVLVKYKHANNGVSVAKFSGYCVNKKRERWRVLYDMDLDECTDYDYRVFEWMPLPDAT